MATARRVQPRQEVLSAGGLNSENVAAAIEQVNPDAIDVSSGVEDSPGIKSIRKLSSLFTAVHHAVRGTSPHHDEKKSS